MTDTRGKETQGFHDVLADIESVQAELASGPQLNTGALQKHLANTVLAFVIMSTREIVAALTYHETRLGNLERNLDQLGEIQELESKVATLVEAGEALLGALASNDQDAIAAAKTALSEVILDVTSGDAEDGDGDQDAA